MTTASHPPTSQPPQRSPYAAAPTTAAQPALQETPVREPREDSPLVGKGPRIEAVDTGLHVLRGQGNSFVIELDEGLVIVDAGPGGKVTAGMIEAVRHISDAPVHAICYSHGHLGYNAGVPQWLAHAQARGEPAPRLIAHANVPRRYARYDETGALQRRMAEIQFRQPHGFFDRHLHNTRPTETFEHRLTLGQGVRRAELLWAPSETDDAIAVWLPEQKVLYGGPALIDSIPNVGTPFRTMRDAVRWADTLERLAGLGAELALREFGPPIVGAEQVRQVLGHTAQALRWLRAEVVQRMNDGMGEREVLASMAYPPELFDVDWMKPTYGDPSYIVRDIYRSENGWWDRNPTSLHPASPQAVAEAQAAAITDKAAVIAQAQALAERGEHQLALHVIDLLATAQGDDSALAEARRLKAQWLRERARQVRSYVSRSLYQVCADRIEGGQAQAFGIR
ncbi:alkyl sulfatase [Comamonas serinivorans]|uniref:Alkyl sulfatase n=1 Tax=Comamonas serinivorans TaxID=1082851 RepID=A0A1Y0EKW9_9BURK|nr:alkyl sulfatase dimerization domain-containing protein [Comamonas serinivorans]ARU04275.1 alkyl sulfatase [Comamonas serinivorans]